MRESLHQLGEVIVNAAKQPLGSRYRIVGVLGEGNSNSIYVVEDITLTLKSVPIVSPFIHK